MRLICLALLCSLTSLAEFATVEELRSHQHEKLAMRVIEVSLQAPDLLELLPIADSALRHLQLIMEPGQAHEGRRMAKVRRKQQLRRGSYGLHAIWKQGSEFANAHNQQGPVQVSDLGKTAPRFWISVPGLTNRQQYHHSTPLSPA